MSNIVLLSDPAGQKSAEDRARLQYALSRDSFVLFPHAREYAPGGSKFFGDSRVVRVNEALTALNNNGTGMKQKLFAVWHEADQKHPISGLFGVVIWATSEREDGSATIMGNPDVEPVPGERLAKGGSNVEVILEWFSAIASLPQQSRENAKRLLDRLTGEEKIKAQREAAQTEAHHALSEAVKSDVTFNMPTNPTRTIDTSSSGPSRETARRRRKENMPTLSE